MKLENMVRFEKKSWFLHIAFFKNKLLLTSPWKNNKKKKNEEQVSLFRYPRVKTDVNWKPVMKKVESYHLVKVSFK